MHSGNLSRQKSNIHSNPNSTSPFIPISVHDKPSCKKKIPSVHSFCPCSIHTDNRSRKNNFISTFIRISVRDKRSRNNNNKKHQSSHFALAPFIRTIPGIARAKITSPIHSFGQAFSTVQALAQQKTPSIHSFCPCSIYPDKRSTQTKKITHESCCTRLTV